MKILHTSDWHLGQALYGKKRYAEFRRFLDWLKELIREEQVETLLVAGDVFDSSLPSNQAQTLYYEFLRDVSLGPCRHIVIIAGNHDSPTFIDAPRELLKTLNVHVIGSPLSPEEEVLALRSPDERIELLVCAVPFLRDRDLFRASAGDSFEQRDQLLAQGMLDHYRRCAQEAERLRTVAGEVPVIAMGHLFTTGGMLADDDGVRDLRIGSLGQVDCSIFPESFDYVALGHLHMPQMVNREERIRYSGAPLPMGFGEAGHRKQVFLLESSGRTIRSRGIEVPCFQHLQKISGDWESLQNQLDELKARKESIWAEALYTGTTIISGLSDRLAEHCPANVELLRVRNALSLSPSFEVEEQTPLLEDMDVYDVFERRLNDLTKSGKAGEEQAEELRTMYRMAVVEFLQDRDGDETCAS